MAFNTSRLIVSLGFVALNAVVPLTGQDDVGARATIGPIDRVDDVMYLDPEFAPPVQEVRVSNDAIELWNRALDRNESSLSRLTIDSIALAKRRGMPGVEAFSDRLLSLLADPELDPERRRAVAKALVDFDDPAVAPELAEAARLHGPAIAVVVEPALILWGSREMADDWTQRLASPEDASSGSNTQMLVVAARGAGALQLQSAGEPLLGFVKSPTSPVAVRMAAAEALGNLYESGLVPLAKALTEPSRSSVKTELMAVRLLSRHQDADALELLNELVARDSTAVQTAALERLFQIDPQLILGYAGVSEEKNAGGKSLLSSPDVNVRSRLAEALIQVRTPETVPPLASLLDDVNPTLRQHAADALVDFAESEELRDVVISETSGVLDQDAWRGCEQAAIVLVNLEHVDCSDRLVDLLRHPRGEVMVTSAWGLRRFALPRHLPAMLGRAEEVFEGFKTNRLTEDSPGYVDMMAQLFMTFGQMKYEPAEPLGMKYLPRNFTYGEKARAAAVWMLGWLHEGDADETLAAKMVERLHDIESNFPEYEYVRLMSVVSLTRMDAKSAVDDLRKYASDSGGILSQACNWGLERLAGDSPVKPRARRPLDYGDWFLRPLVPPVQ